MLLRRITSLSLLRRPSSLPPSGARELSHTCTTNAHSIGTSACHQSSTQPMAFGPTPIRRALVVVDGAADSSVNASSVIHARQWNSTPNWCDLCKEPINTWNDHRGKREHICLEMFYDRIVGHQDRAWEPVSALKWDQYMKGLAMESLLDHYDAVNDFDRRREILTLTKYLADNEVLFIGQRRLAASPFAKLPTMVWGSAIQYKLLFSPLINIFPYADAKEISCITQMVSGLFNLETLYDLVGFRQLMTAADIPRGEPRSIGTRTDAVHDLHFNGKGSFVRGLLGQLRWCVEEDSCACPLPFAVPPHMLVICQRLLHMLITELIGIRISEYTVRVEGVWRDHYAPKICAPPPQSEVPPLPISNKGILAYYHNRLHSTDYKGMLGTDPRGMERKSIQFLQDLQRGKRDRPPTP